MNEPTGTLVDSSVLIDLFTDDPVWASWSVASLRYASLQGPLWINETIFSEVSISFTSIEAFREALAEIKVDVKPLPLEAAFLAGKAFVAYRARGGAKTTPLPDFFIGAHAAVQGIPLLTRDPRRVRQAYPRLVLIQP